jgi:2-methylcitrate dehydratase PrpD
VIGPFGAAAAAGKLLRLDDEQLADALGYAANFSSGFRECFVTGFMERKFNDAMASRNGVTAALLAKAGAKASRNSLEGQYGFYQAFTGTTERLETATIDLGERFLVMDATYKPYPASAEVQIIVHLALSLVEQHAFKDEEVTEMIETVPDNQMTPDPSYSNPGPFTSRLQAASSAPFNLAATLLGRPITDYAFYDNYDDPEVLKLAKKVRIVRKKEGDTTRIEVTLRSGKRYMVEEGNVGFLVPTTDRVKAKFARLASDSLGENKVNRITDIVLNLSEVPDISQLTRELQG